MHIAATGCGRSEDPDYHDGKHPSFTVNTKPTVSDGGFSPDPTGHGTFNVSYSFPNTDRAGHQRAINVSVADEGINGLVSAESSGVWTFDYSAACKAPGSHQVRVEATACEQAGDPDYTDVKPASFVIAGQTKATPTWDKTTQTLTIDYEFPN